MDAADYMAAMRIEFPDLVDELDDETWCGLLHVETGCFARYTMTALDSGDRPKVKRCFDFARHAWMNGDQNALGVSYLEHLNFADGKAPRSWAFALLAPPLRHAAEQLGVSPGYQRP